MTTELAQLIAKRYIARGDVKAVQMANGDYMPHRLDNKKAGTPEDAFYPWRVEDIDAHLERRATYGHYVVNTSNRTKLITFDIDIEQKGFLSTEPMPCSGDPGSDPWASDADIIEWEKTRAECSPRELWRDRSQVPARNRLKAELRLAAHGLMDYLVSTMEVETACAYSGNKGLHVYGFTGPIEAHGARIGAEITLSGLGWIAVPGRASTYKHTNFPNLSIEVYPKQDTIPDGGFGNLVRLPLGRNLRAPKDPTFFVDMTAPANELRPVDPIWALTEGSKSPWKAMTDA